MRVERVEDAAAVEAGADLFDEPVRYGAVARFLERPGHHLLFAYDADDRAVGFVSGVETTHPDKGTEMFLYELGVAEHARGNGVGTALVEELAALARDIGCYGMWTATDPDNAAALATYRRAGVDTEEPTVALTWTFRRGAEERDPG